MKKKTSLACIIDDDGMYIRLLKKIIEARKLCDNLLIFNNGKESIDYFEAILKNLHEEEVPDIMFIDLNMPIMDGWEFIERFTKIENKFNKLISLYIVSSSINPVDIDRAKSLSNIKDYLVKPVRITELETIFKKSA
ncbi:response regulator [Gelidibacter japonicus]|jgi:CheY-like chemotaxis protein|uniref:response regulator n=1 Tax=Gelidibacter japonicus TaxID=1962232 RepID=UPI0013D43394|nr:response regulator [Gelidibacter japonicus]MCL8007872.1 response regulator [Gelidibacter japonicus]